jgi:hypothetical protein
MELRKAELSAKAGFDGAASAFMPLVDPGHRGILALRLAL